MGGIGPISGFNRVVFKNEISGCYPYALTIYVLFTIINKYIHPEEITDYEKDIHNYIIFGHAIILPDGTGCQNTACPGGQRL